MFALLGISNSKHGLIKCEKKLCGVQELTKMHFYTLKGLCSTDLGTKTSLALEQSGANIFHV